MTSKKAGAAVVALLSLAPLPAPAADEHCLVQAIFAEPLTELRRVADTVKRDNKLQILILSGSPSQTGAAKGLRSYPSFFENALRQRLPGLEIKVVVRAAPRRTVPDLLPKLPAILSETQPAVVIWQVGTADAYSGLDADIFADALTSGAATVLQSGADLVLVDMQFSPRTDALVDTVNYIANIRRVAETMDVPLFSRYDIMRYWNDSGAFDLGSLRNDGLFEKVHACIGDLLSDFLVRAAALNELKDER